MLKTNLMSVSVFVDYPCWFSQKQKERKKTNKDKTMQFFKKFETILQILL